MYSMEALLSAENKTMKRPLLAGYNVTTNDKEKGGKALNPLREEPLLSTITGGVLIISRSIKANFYPLMGTFNTRPKDVLERTM